MHPLPCLPSAYVFFPPICIVILLVNCHNFTNFSFKGIEVLNVRVLAEMGVLLNLKLQIREIGIGRMSSITCCCLMAN